MLSSIRNDIELPESENDLSIPARSDEPTSEVPGGSCGEMMPMEEMLSGNTDVLLVIATEIADPTVDAPPTLKEAPQAVNDPNAKDISTDEYASKKPRSLLSRRLRRFLSPIPYNGVCLPLGLFESRSTSFLSETYYIETENLMPYRWRTVCESQGLYRSKFSVYRRHTLLPKDSRSRRTAARFWI